MKATVVVSFYICHDRELLCAWNFFLGHSFRLRKLIYIVLIKLLLFFVLFSLSWYINIIWTIYCGQAGSRKVLFDVVPTIWNDVSVLIKSDAATRSPLLRKHLVKLTQRIGLTCLPHRSPTWRYVVSIAECFCFLVVNCIYLGLLHR